jgi:hypothetical protein
MNSFYASLIFCVLIFSGEPLLSQSQTWQWARSSTGSQMETVTCMATDQAGNVIVAGYYYGSTITIGSITYSTEGNYDILVTKYSPSGNVLWAKCLGGIYDDVALGICSDLNGNVFVTGYFYSPSISFATSTITNSGAGDIFVVKISSAGNILWANAIGGTDEESGLALSSDSNGNCYLAGVYKTDGLVLGSDTLKNNGGDDALLVKINGSGGITDTKSFGGSKDDQASAISLDSNGNIFLSGLFYSSSLSCGNSTIVSQGSNDSYVLKLDPAIQTLWLKGLGGAFNDFAGGIAADQNGDVFITGTYNSSVITIGSNTFTNTGGFDFYVAKYHSNGNLLWARSEGDIFDDTGISVTTDGTGHAFVTGHFHSPSIILGTDTLYNSGIGDLFVSGYNGTTGNIMWTEKTGGASDDGSSSIACDNAGNLFIGGFFISPSISCPEFTVSNSGSTDLLVLKLKLEYSTLNLNTFLESASPGVFPNPSSGKFFLTDLPPVYSTITVLNDEGKTILSLINTQDHTVIDLSANPPGIYILLVNSEKTHYCKKIVLTPY